MFDFIKKNLFQRSYVKELKKEIEKLNDDVGRQMYRADMYQIELRKIKHQHAKDINDWNRLVRELKSMGGLDAIRRKMSEPSHVNSSFSKEEIRILIQLSHPDRHGGKDVYNQIMQKLNKMKG